MKNLQKVLVCPSEVWFDWSLSLVHRLIDIFPSAPVSHPNLLVHLGDKKQFQFKNNPLHPTTHIHIEKSKCQWSKSQSLFSPLRQAKLFQFKNNLSTHIHIEKSWSWIHTFLLWFKLDCFRTEYLSRRCEQNAYADMKIPVSRIVTWRHKVGCVCIKWNLVIVGEIQKFLITVNNGQC